MLTINNLEEMEPYYNRDTNTYEFAKNGKKLDVCFNIPLNIKANIKARNIKATDIKVQDIKARNIKATDIKTTDIKAQDINADSIDVRDTNSWDIDAENMEFYATYCMCGTLLSLFG